ncbi:MAG: DsrE/DsrF/TusD sulfur relay family protein [Bacillota bacterium]
MEKILFLINDAPYGTEKMFNALRLAINLLKQHKDEVEVKVFLMGDAVTGILTDQELPKGYYNIETMLRSVINQGGEVKACGTCANARGIENLKLIDGAEISTMNDLSQWTVEADKVFTF